MTAGVCTAHDLGKACKSAGAPGEDANVYSCQGWCDPEEMAHCQMCKCRGCSFCPMFPPSPPMFQPPQSLSVSWAHVWCSLLSLFPAKARFGSPDGIGGKGDIIKDHIAIGDEAGSLYLIQMQNEGKFRR